MGVPPRSHCQTYPVGSFDQLPGLAVRVSLRTALPVMVGGAVLAGHCRWRAHSRRSGRALECYIKAEDQAHGLSLLFRIAREHHHRHARRPVAPAGRRPCARCLAVGASRRDRIRRGKGGEWVRDRTRAAPIRPGRPRRASFPWHPPSGTARTARPRSPRAGRGRDCRPPERTAAPIS